MKAEELKSIIKKIKEYDLTESFSSPQEIEEWLKGLNQRQINNFINLSIPPNEIDLPLGMLTNENLLNCEDYEQRVRALNKVKNGEGCWHLFGSLCSVHFLKSKTFYEDLKLIATADTARYVLWVIGDEVFANSPYRDEDLKLIVNAKDESEEELDWLIAEGLARTAQSKESIASKHHREDMKLIAKCHPDALQMGGAFPDRGVNKLAINEVSLKDPYHRENMELLATAPVADTYLYQLMTDSFTVKSKTYRQEIEALYKAKSELKALAIYHFLENPKIEFNWELSNKLGSDMFSLNAYELGRNKTIRGINHPNYKKCVDIINSADDKYVLFIASILADKYSIDSGDQDLDIQTILSVTDEDIFMDLYKVMTNKNSLESINHRHDVILIAKEQIKEKRKMLVAKATDKKSLELRTHEFDMEFISALDMSKYDKKTIDKMYYYLFNNTGLNHPRHTEILERLAAGEPIEDINEITDYLNQLEENANGFVSEPKPKKGFLARILKLK